MKVTALEKIPEDPETILAWNNLVLRMERPEVFFTQQWALAASRAFSENIRPLIFLVYDSERLTGVAAMATNRESPNAAFFLTASTADYCDIVSETETRSAVLEAVIEEMERLNVRDLILANVPALSHTLRALARVTKSHGFYLHERLAYNCGVIALENKDQRETVLQTVMHKKNERRGLERLGRLGPLRVTHLSAQQIERGLGEIVVAHISRFLATNRVSPLIFPQRRSFLKELGELLNSAGWLKISQLEVDGHPIAWNYGFRFLDSWFWYLPTFLTEFEESSPGNCLLRLLTEEACADPLVKRLDLGLGVEPYKDRFSNAILSTRHIQLTKRLSQHMSNVGRHGLKVLSKKVSAVEKQLRKGQKLVHVLKSRIDRTGVTATATHALTRAKRGLASEDEISIFEAPDIPDTQTAENLTLTPLSWEQIALGAMNNFNDEPTLKYLARSAYRMKESRAAGYCLLSQRNQPVHFLWVENYDGFHVTEMDSSLESSDASAVMIFDCWTPAAERGQGNYVAAIRLATGYLQAQQKKVWIFSATGNKFSIRGISKAGFIYRFSLVRRRRLMHKTLSPSVRPI